MGSSIKKTVINLLWRNTLIGFSLTILWLTLFDIYQDIYFNKYFITEYTIVAAFSIIPIFMINTLYLILLIKRLYRFLWANILFLVLPGALSLMCYQIIDRYENLEREAFYSVVYTFLLINFILGVLSVPGLIKRTQEANGQRRTLKWYGGTLASVIILLLLSAVFIPPRSIEFKNHIFPGISLNIIDKAYIPPAQIDNADYIDVRYKLIWSYNCFESYFDSVVYSMSDHHVLGPDGQGIAAFDNIRENYMEHRVASRILDSNIDFQPGTIYLALAQDEIDTIYNNYKGMHLYLINSKQDTLTLPGIDGSLYIIQEAKDFLGNWRLIEQYPTSWCGNSYFDISLPPNNFMRFTVPRYDGMFKTEFRFRLNIDSETILYSNSYVGKINPGQFFINGKYLPGNLMDPYY